LSAYELGTEYLLASWNIWHMNNAITQEMYIGILIINGFTGGLGIEATTIADDVMEMIDFIFEDEHYASFIKKLNELTL
jgi:hypothetical protein